MKTLFRLFNKKLEKSQMGLFLVKNLKFFLVFNLVKIGQENLFDDILERKKAFLQYENTKLKKSKHWDFSKKLVKIGLENVFKDILGSKKSLSRPWTQKARKKAKNWDFSIQHSPSFWWRIWNFSLFLV